MEKTKMYLVNIETTGIDFNDPMINQIVDENPAFCLEDNNGVRVLIIRDFEKQIGRMISIVNPSYELCRILKAPTYMADKEFDLLEKDENDETYISIFDIELIDKVNYKKEQEEFEKLILENDLNVVFIDELENVDYGSCELFDIGTVKALISYSTVIKQNGEMLLIGITYSENISDIEDAFPTNYINYLITDGRKMIPVKMRLRYV
jgi:hypothetical protein